MTFLILTITAFLKQTEPLSLLDIAISIGVGFLVAKVWPKIREKMKKEEEMKDPKSLVGIRGVVFKSISRNFEKERDGEKSNTFRRIDKKDQRFRLLREGEVKYIKIVNPKTKETFIREITDYTEWKGWAIISWRTPK